MREAVAGANDKVLSARLQPADGSPDRPNWRDRPVPWPNKICPAGLTRLAIRADCINLS
jgi:hypothetical protein